MYMCTLLWKVIKSRRKGDRKKGNENEDMYKRQEGVGERERRREGEIEN